MQKLNTSYQKIPALTLAALGIVFGDIGTSPLYAFKEIFFGHHPLETTPANIYGVLSLIVWSLILVVTVKYVLFVMLAHNRGEGGIMALIALALQKEQGKFKRQALILFIGMIGASMFFADALITPAISVLSAIEGLRVAAPQLDDFIIPITLAVLLGVFALQQYGTGTVGKFFGPIVFCWFTVLTLLGIFSIAQTPEVLWALNPYYAIDFFISHPVPSFLSLGAVVLVVTGGEALYADMGHFGAFPIRLAWFCFVLPALVINYFGQGALILRDVDVFESSVFYVLAPEWVLFPLIVLATLATVIASQAVISGTFSVMRQAILLNFMPRTLVLHTSEEEKGQIYLPVANWAMMIGVMALVLWFQNSSNLSAAYGIAVTGDMVITTLLAGYVFYRILGWRVKSFIFVAVFLVIDLGFFSANILKIPQGGYVPIIIGVVLLTVMLTWKQGSELFKQRTKKDGFELSEFLQALEISSPTRVSDTAVFLSYNTLYVPHALLHNLKHNKVLHEQVAIVHVRILDIPYVEGKDRIVVEPLPSNFYRITLFYGFIDEPNVPRDLKLYAQSSIKFEIMSTTFFINRETLIAKGNQGMMLWRKKLFITMYRNADHISNYFKLPPNRVIELGAQVII